MPHALLLSPDDQAVSAITGVLEEMSVTCERPLDGPSAAKKLNSQSFDLVLVDCENLPAAKLIFDVCRRSQTGTNPVPIAIVDGRAGLPTAFRLGAELILTKPVAKDQARTTIRTAVSRVRKDEPARAIPAFEEIPTEPVQPAIHDTRAHAAAAASSASPAGSEEHDARIAPPEPMPKMSSTAEETTPAQSAHKAQPVFFGEVAVNPAEATKVAPLPKAPRKASDDPVLADLESDLPTPVFTSYVQPQKKKGHGTLVALLLVVLTGGGLYAAWMYQPGFREIAQPQIDRLLAAVGTRRAQPPSAPPQQPLNTVTPPAPSPSATTAAPASDAAADPAVSNTTNPESAPADSATPPAVNSAPATASAAPETAKATEPAEPKKSVVAAVPSDTELPGEKTAVILSSQGAEKRLIRHIPPVYPADARKERVEGTVVLKAVVSDGGRVEGVRLVEGNPALANAAISAVKQWHYRPYIRDGKARPFQTIVLVEFQQR